MTMTLIFSKAAWNNGKSTIWEAETNKGIRVQIHKDVIDDEYWHEATVGESVIYDSRSDNATFANYNDAEQSAQNWFDNFK